MKKVSLEIPKGIQEKIPSSSAKKGFMGAVKFFNDLVQYALGSEEFPHDPSVDHTFSTSHNKGAVRNLLLLTRSATRMTGFMKENHMGRPAIEVVVYHEKIMVAKFLAVFWHDGKVAGITPLKQWDTTTGTDLLTYQGGSRFALKD